jgi:hypothetical protein
VRVAATDGVRSEVQVLGHCGTGGPDHRVRRGQQPLHQPDVVNLAGIGDDTVLCAGQEGEQRAVTARWDGAARGRPPAQRITFWWLNFDDAGTTVGEQFGAVGTRYAGGQIDHRVAGQGRFDPVLRH